MKHYDSFGNVKYDDTLLGEDVWIFNKLDGQNFCAKFSPKEKRFNGFGSKTKSVDCKSEQFGGAIKFFQENMEDKLIDIILSNSNKGGIFSGVNEITLFFEWYGDKTFCGFHKQGDKLKLCLIDVFLYKKGFIEPEVFYNIFYNIKGIEVPELIYVGKLTTEFINDIQNNDWTQSDCKYPTVKEGVVCKLSKLLKGQRLLKIKIKTKWWMTKLIKKYPTRWKELE